MGPCVALALDNPSEAADLSRRLGEVARVSIIEADELRTVTQGVIETSPHVIVLELTQIRNLARFIISLIKAASPETLIIAYSPEPSDEDASAIEEGIYFYAGGISAERLEEIVRAALRTRSRTDGSLFDPQRVEGLREPPARG